MYVHKTIYSIIMYIVGGRTHSYCTQAGYFGLLYITFNLIAYVHWGSLTSAQLF